MGYPRKASLMQMDNTNDEQTLIERHITSENSNDNLFL